MCWLVERMLSTSDGSCDEERSESLTEKRIADSGTSFHMTLLDVAYVPDLSFNLFR